MKAESIIIQKNCLEYPLAKRLKDKYSHLITVTEKEELIAPGTIAKMKSTVLVTEKNGFSVKKMGDGTGNPACDYDIEFICGCPHHCVYCQQIYFLEDTPYIEIYPDLEKVLCEIKNVVKNEKKSPVIFEAGNLTDLLSIEHLTGFLKELIPFFANELDGRGRLHFLTKSTDVKEILDLCPKGMTRVGFSLNLPEFSKKYELKSSVLSERTKAIRAVLKAGYKLHLSFSPIIYRENIIQDYEELFRKTKEFLLSCDGYNEEDLNLEGIIFFQKMNGERLMKRYYPGVSESLLKYFEYNTSGGETRFSYPENIYNELLNCLKDGFEKYFPKANVLFAS